MRVNLSCLDNEQMRQLADGAMNTLATELALAHLDECPACQQRFLDQPLSCELTPLFRALSSTNPLRDSTVSRHDLTSREVGKTFDPQADASVPVARIAATTTPAAIEAKTPARRDAVGTAAGNAARSEAKRTQVPKGPILGHIGSRELLKSLGAGGMGTVYLARHTVLGRFEAVKILPEEYRGDPLLRGRFQREAQVFAEMEHDHVVRAFDAGEQDGVPFLAMEYLDGRSLADLLRCNGSLEVGVSVKSRDKRPWVWRICTGSSSCIVTSNRAT